MPSMQIDVPAEVYGRCDWFVPPLIAKWLRKNHLSYGFTGSSSWGAGERQEGHYIISNIDPEHASLFKIQFPHCRVHIVDDQS